MALLHGARLPVLRRGLRPAGARGDDARRAERVLGPASLPEVAGDAALLFDPADPAAIRTAIERLLDDDVLRALRDAGLARRDVLWERTAREMGRTATKWALAGAWAPAGSAAATVAVTSAACAALSTGLSGIARCVRATSSVTAAPRPRHCAIAGCRWTGVR